MTTPSTPAWLKVSSYFLILFLAALLASRVPVLDGMFYYFGIAFVISYFMLRSEGKRLADLGSLPVTKRDRKYFLGGTLVGMLALIISAVITIWLNGGRLVINDRIDPVFVFVLLLMHLWSAFAQEFTYRGYPFQRLLQAYGPWVAQLGVTLPFAVMHLKLNMPLTPEQFFMTWLTTGLGSLLYGLSYIRTGNLSLATGLHFGWNIAQALVPRSIVQPKTMIFTLVGNEQPEQNLYVLLPYLLTSVVLIFMVSRLPSKAERQRIIIK